MGGHKPSRIHQFFSELFHSRSRSQSPRPKEEHGQVESHAGQEPDRAASPHSDKEVQLPHPSTQPSPARDHRGPESKPSGSQDVAHATSSRPGNPALSHSPDVKVSGTAYDEAWSRLSEGERANLSDDESIQTLFQRLDEADEQHQSGSWLKRGKMAAGLQYVSSICGYVNLVAAWIPVPDLGASLSLIKGIVAIFVGICGAYDSLTGHIREFLGRIPVLDRCNTILWANSASFEIHNILVACYSSLLSFYSKVMAFLQEESRIIRILEAFHSEIPGIVTEFNGHADKLSKMMEVETLVTVKKILDQQTEDFVDDNLYKQHHFGDHKIDEEDVSDEACRWILHEDSFEDWAYGPHGVLTMYGVVGCGKSVTAAFVTRYLREQARAPVLAYHCAQQEEDELRYIMCSLTYQLLQAKVELKESFKDWSEEWQATTLDKPSNKPAVLAEFLSTSLQDSREQVFIILDGLDECEEDARSELLALFRDLISKGALVKVFVSSRQRDDILQTLSSRGTMQEASTAEPAHQIPLFHIDMNPTEERDLILAKYLAAKPLRQIQDDKVRERAIGQLARRAGGSAIWLQMAMSSLAGAKNESRIERCLAFLETDPKLVDMYESLFMEAESATCDDREVLERALETLAVARRPMTVGELSRAAHMDDPGCAGSLARLNEAAEEIDFLGLVRPFVATSADSRHGDGVRVRLVHQSLLELLLAARPSEWDSMVSAKKSKRVTDEDKEQRRRELNRQLMGRCVRYLLLDDLEDGPSQGGSGMEADTTTDVGAEDEDAWDGLGFASLFAEPETQKRTETRAQVSHLHFYEYAASHWVSHFAACERDVPDDLREKAKTLLDVTSSGCTDWVSFVRAEKEAVVEPFPSSSEPVTLLAYFGLHETLAGVLSEGVTVIQQTKDEALHWASRGGHEGIVGLLLEHGADPNQHHLSDGHTALMAAAYRGHLGCVRALLASARADVNAQSNRMCTALMLAALGGSEEVCAALVQREDCRPDEVDWRGMTALFYAVGVENTAVIRLLAALPGVDVNHRDNAGRTALCRSAETGTTASLVQLLEAEGVDVNLPDNERRTPLMCAALRGKAASVEALLRHPGIDTSGRALSNDGKNPIHFACEAGRHEALQSLLAHGCPGVDDPDVDSWTPLMWAVQNGPGCVSALLATGRVQVGRRDSLGKTPLLLAVQWGHSVEVLRVLLHYGADPEAADDHGATPMTVAVNRGLPLDLRMADELSSWISKRRGDDEVPARRT